MWWRSTRCGSIVITLVFYVQSHEHLKEVEDKNEQNDSTVVYGWVKKNLITKGDNVKAISNSKDSCIHFF